MKFRVIGLVLAVVAVVSLTLTAFAATVEGENGAEDGASSVTEEVTEPAAPFYLDGTPVDTLVYQVKNNVNYITVESFMALMDCEAVVEEENGVLTVNAITVTGVVDVENKAVEGSGEDAGETEATAEEPGETAGETDEAAEETGEAAEEIAEANVEEETLNLTTRVDAFYVVANGRYLYVEDGVIAVDGKVALPIRVLAKVFNLSVAYDGETKSVQLSRQEGADAYLADADSYYNSDTLYWLSHIIYAESGNQCLEGKLAVGNVVMNRVEHPSFPDNIYDVLFQKNQFSPAASGSIYREPNAESVVAAKLVLDGAEVLEDALFFNRAGMNTRAARTRTHVATIGAHAFYA